MASALENLEQRVLRLETLVYETIREKFCDFDYNCHTGNFEFLNKVKIKIFV
ncbi:MAG: hypothetical protein ABDI07_01630 [Candidatus Kryptonium sp.]